MPTTMPRSGRTLRHTSSVGRSPCCAAPSGIAGEQFFQKHAWKGLNPNIALVNDPKDPDEGPLISIDDLDGLIGLVQAAVLEIHPWGSTVADWERPDIDHHGSRSGRRGAMGGRSLPRPGRRASA